MSDESGGVVTFRATRTTMIDAIGDALPAPGKRWRRKYPLAVPDLADAIMAGLPVVEPSALKAITEAERIIAERDEEIARQARVIRDVQGAASDMGGRCDDQFALNRGLREQAAEDKEQILALRSALARTEAEATGLRDKAAEYENAICWHTSCTSCARTLDSSIAEHDRADKAEAELARVAAALAPLTVTTGMTHAERALAAGVIRDSISLPPPARPEGLTVHACQVDETGADPYQGLGSGGMIP
jgi:hypothetical protein